jgi:5,10-methylenetetrahydrofolate reductase
MPSNVFELRPPDKPENVEALRAMVEAVRHSKEIGFDRETFVRAAKSVWDGVTESDLEEEDQR